MASHNYLSLSLCILVLFHGCAAQFDFTGQSIWHSSHGFREAQRDCRFDNLAALEPSRHVQSQAGVTEFYEDNNYQLKCAGLSALRRIIEPRGLLLPAFSNAPSLFYVVQGRGLMGFVLPGCPETYQFFQQSEQESIPEVQRTRDEHQKIHRIREGDVIAIPSGITHWSYNDGDIPLVVVQVFDTSNGANQLENRRREFFLAGRHRSGQQFYELGQQVSGNNILNGFETQLLAEAFGINRELARRLQGQDDQRGEIVRVEHGLQLLRPFRSQAEQQQQQQQEEVIGGERFEEEERFDQERLQSWNRSNGLDENFCTLKIRQNINDPNRADIFNPQSGRITRLNSQKLPILNHVQLSATRVVLRRNAILTPFWNVNAHSLMYVTGGHGRVQIVNHQGKTVFDGQLRSRQLLLIPQNFVVLKKADPQQHFEWVSFKTNHNAIVNKLVGKRSTIRALPLDVLGASYRITTEQARRLKNSRREEFALFTPRFQYQGEELGIEFGTEPQRNDDVTEA